MRYNGKKFNAARQQEVLTMSSPISNQPNTIPIHIVYVTGDSIEPYEDIFQFCETKGLRFTERDFDSVQYSDDRYEITRLPAIHVYLKSIRQMTIYPNENAIESIDICIKQYEADKARMSNLDWIKLKLNDFRARSWSKKPIFKRRVLPVKAEVVTSDFTNPM